MNVGSGFLKKKKQARMMQEQFSAMQEKFSSQLEGVTITGTAGNGLVEVVLNGSGDLQAIHIKPECVDPQDIEGLEVLIKAAFDDGAAKLKAQSEQAMNLQGMGELSSLLKF
jgi:hypothetical protein